MVGAPIFMSLLQFDDKASAAMMTAVRKGDLEVRSYMHMQQSLHVNQDAKTILHKDALIQDCHLRILASVKRRVHTQARSFLLLTAHALCASLFIMV